MEYGYLDKEVKALVAERDRLAAENARLERENENLDIREKSDFKRLHTELAAANADYASLLESHEIILDALIESDATLDRLREIIPEHLTPGRAHRLYVNDVIRAKILLYPKETDNG